jgi:hypothetical protein
MSEATKTEAKPAEGHGAAAAPAKPIIHRVCVTCNAMFKVTPENFATKICPNCHKG